MHTVDSISYWQSSVILSFLIESKRIQVSFLRKYNKLINNTVDFKMSMYIRLKRKNQTFFLLVEPSENFLSVKTKIADYYKMQPNQINIYTGNTEKVR